MNSNKIAGVLLFINFVLISCGIYFFTAYKSEAMSGVAPEPKVLGSNTFTNTTISDGDALKTFKICTKDFCQIISSRDIASFYDGGIIRKNRVAAYVSKNIIPSLERYYGGRTTVSNRNGSFNTWVRDVHPNLTKIVDNIMTILEDKNESTNIYNIDVSVLPGTDGTYATKYMEVDYSSQKLYVWVNGEVVRTILLSGPIHKYEVYGVFPIIDKGIEPVAPGGKYMPYWMAFYHSTSQDSWYGLHALIWWYGVNGEKVYESTNNIGTRQSAGCIRMLLEDAKYLYENFDRGDFVLIHE